MLSTPSLPLALVEERLLASIGLWGVVESAWREQCLVDDSRSPEAGRPAGIVKSSEKKVQSEPFVRCRNEYRAQLEKEYAFQHLTERLLEAEGGYEAIRAEGRALFDRFKEHDRYLEADLVELFLSHVVRGVIERMGRSDRTFQRYIFALQAPLQGLVARYANELRGNGGAWVNAGRQMEGLWSNLLLLRRSFNV